MRCPSLTAFVPLVFALTVVAVPFGCARGLRGALDDGSGGSGGTDGVGGTTAVTVGSKMSQDTVTSGPSTGDVNPATSDVSAGPSTSVGSSTSVGEGPATVGSGPATVGSGPATVGSGPATSASSGGGPCDNSGDCNTCANCAQSGMCAPQSDACDNDPNLDCTFFELCIQQCGMNDQACFNDCVQQNPNGAQLYNDLALCIVCMACYGDCGGAQAGCP